MKVGFIGLGIMGNPMVLNFIKAGHALSLYSRSGVPRAVPANLRSMTLLACHTTV